MARSEHYLSSMSSSHLLRAAVLILAAFLLAAPPAAAQDLGAIICADCHGTQVHDFMATRHAAALYAQGRRDAASLCGACHGEVLAHAEAAKPREVPVQFRFKNPKDLDTATANGRCLACHASGMSPKPLDGLHLGAGLRCTTCHTGMGKGGLPRLRKLPEKELCGSCHAQAVAPFRAGHRPDRAEALCTFCHDPHGREKRLIARDCTSCHKTYAYPKPFEHPPVDEGCLSCHEPHGTADRFLLKEARPALCLGCHSQLETLHRIDTARSPFQLYEGCQNCHPRIHGSDALGGFRFQR